MSAVFIHIPKNGGTSIRKIGSELGITMGNNSVVSNILPKHERWLDLNISKKTPSFGIVRNPWSRCVSRYMFSRLNISFKDFIDKRLEWDGLWHDPVTSWSAQYDYVCDENGYLCCSILRLEHLNNDLSNYMKTKVNVKKENVTGYKNYTNFYDNKTIQIVADWYKKDIDFWGFDFNTAATKNYFN